MLAAFLTYLVKFIVLIAIAVIGFISGKKFKIARMKKKAETKQ